MFSRLKLKNFQKHEGLEVVFDKGLIALKAPNEGGKSTILRAIAYALFGAKVLPEPLDSTVTWGCHVNTLKVELDFVVAGKLYRIYRGKSGAQIDFDGGTVTGQTETAGFVAELLGVDGVGAMRLLVANQGEIRGALSQGSKAATAMIEKLAGIDQLDKVLALIQANLPTGSTVAAQAALDQLEADLAALPTVDEAARASAEAALKGLQEKVSGLVLEREVAKAKVIKLQESATSYSSWGAEVGRSKAEVANLEHSIRQYRREPEVTKDSSPLLTLAREGLEAAREKDRSARTVNQIHEGEARLVAVRQPYTFEEAKTKLAGFASEANGLREKSANLVTKTERLEGSLLSGTCTFCGLNVGDVPQAAQKNAGIAAEIRQLRGEALRFEDRLGVVTGEQRTLENLLQAQRDLEKFIDAANGVDVEFDKSVTPWLPLNLPPVVDKGAAEVGVQACLAEVARLEAVIKDEQEERTARAGRTAELGVLHSRLVGEQAKLGSLLTAEPTRVEDADLAQARQVLLKTDQEVESSKETIVAISANIAAMNRDRQHLERQQQQIQSQVSLRKEEVAQLGFNNALVRKVRDSRTAIVDQVWALTTGTISSAFSQMRGVPTEVTRGDDGFTVDGHPASSFSGSTLDSLGLAIRAALLRTFLPGLDCLILDEPNAAMDEERTANVLGYLRQTGFGQVLIVSHDEMTADVADQIIDLV